MNRSRRVLPPKDRPRQQYLGRGRSPAGDLASRFRRDRTGDLPVERSA